MPITDAIHKGDRLEQIRVLFLRRPEGVGTMEIAQLLGISQRTARRYVIELSERGRLPVYRQGRVWKLVEGGHLNLLRIELNLDEALALYLAARMLSAYSDKHNPHMVASLFKLAEVLPEAIGEHVERAAEAVSQRQPASKYLNVLEGLIRAWASRRQVRLTYRDPISGAALKAPVRSLFHRTVLYWLFVLCVWVRSLSPSQPLVQARAVGAGRGVGHPL